MPSPTNFDGPLSLLVLQVERRCAPRRRPPRRCRSGRWSARSSSARQLRNAPKSSSAASRNWLSCGLGLVSVALRREAANRQLRILAREDRVVDVLRVGRVGHVELDVAGVPVVGLQDRLPVDPLHDHVVEGDEPGRSRLAVACLQEQLDGSWSPTNTGALGSVMSKMSMSVASMLSRRPGRRAGRPATRRPSGRSWRTRGSGSARIVVSSMSPKRWTSFSDSPGPSRCRGRSPRSCPRTADAGGVGPVSLVVTARTSPWKPARRARPHGRPRRGSTAPGRDEGHSLGLRRIADVRDVRAAPSQSGSSQELIYANPL